MTLFWEFCFVSSSVSWKSEAQAHRLVGTRIGQAKGFARRTDRTLTEARCLSWLVEIIKSRKRRYWWNNDDRVVSDDVRRTQGHWHVLPDEFQSMVFRINFLQCPSSRRLSALRYLIDLSNYCRFLFSLDRRRRDRSHFFQCHFTGVFLRTRAVNNGWRDEERRNACVEHDCLNKTERKRKKSDQTSRFLLFSSVSAYFLAVTPRAIRERKRGKVVCQLTLNKKKFLTVKRSRNELRVSFQILNWHGHDVLPSGRPSWTFMDQFDSRHFTTVPDAMAIALSAPPVAGDLQYATVDATIFLLERRLLRQQHDSIRCQTRRDRNRLGQPFRSADAPRRHAGAAGGGDQSDQSPNACFRLSTIGIGVEYIWQRSESDVRSDENKLVRSISQRLDLQWLDDRRKLPNGPILLGSSKSRSSRLFCQLLRRQCVQSIDRRRHFLRRRRRDLGWTRTLSRLSRCVSPSSRRRATSLVEPRLGTRIAVQKTFLASLAESRRADQCWFAQPVCTEDATRHLAEKCSDHLSGHVQRRLLQTVGELYRSQTTIGSVFDCPRWLLVVLRTANLVERRFWSWLRCADWEPWRIISEVFSSTLDQSDGLFRL